MDRLRIAITMDDLPVHASLPPGETRQSVAAAIVSAFRAAGVPEVYGFVNAASVEADPTLASALTAWMDAGYPLANHGWSHARFDNLTLDQFEDELVRNEPYLKQYGGGRDWRWFRYPFLAEGADPAKRAAGHALVARHGYRIAGVTMDYSDWQWSDAYARCRAAGDAEGLKTLERTYLEAVRETIGYSRQLSKAIYGRDIPYLLLTHVSAFNARMMPQVLDIYREQGFSFVSLAEAYRDPVYGDGAGEAPPHATMEERAALKGIPLPARQDRTATIAAVCRG